MPLKTYRSKRNFSQTPEPQGKLEKGRVHRFVVQKHDASHLHYDFRLEFGGTLKSWAVPKGPSLNPADKRLAMHVEDHPLSYRTFEGIIPEGNYGAGTVMVWDEGEVTVEDGTNYREIEQKLREGYENGDIKFTLHGKKLKGMFGLVQMHGKGDKAWLLLKKKDRFASEDNVLEKAKSVSTGRTLVQIAEGRAAKSTASKKKASAKEEAVFGTRSSMPTKIHPMLATLAGEPFDRKQWIFEIKWDGYRTIAFLESGRVRLRSRNQLNFDKKMAVLIPELEQIEHDTILDGEVVAVDEKGRASFQRLQNYFKTGEGRLIYYVFDLLHLDGYDVRGLTLLERKELLKKILPKSASIKFSAHVDEKGVAFFESARKQGLEGIIAKDGKSAYSTGKRTKDWLKIKAVNQQEATIVGFTEPRGSRKHMGAFILAVQKEGEWEYVGHANAGASPVGLKDFHEKLRAIEQKDSVFERPPKTNAPVHWVKPKYVAEVKFQEWTDDERMRHPIFLGIREDKSPTDVVAEKPKGKLFGTEGPKNRKDEKIFRANGQEIVLTHAHKVFFPHDGITKGDLADYYHAIAHILLPYLKDRPESLNRHPGGIEDSGFYQKDNPNVPDWVKTKKIFSESTQEDVEYIVCNDEATLLYLVQLGCIDINPWNSRLKHLEKPDFMIMDLDPEAIGFKEVVKTALVVKDVLDELKVPAYCKTSGATGIHIQVPMEAKYDYKQVKMFAHLVAQFVHERLPKITSIERNPKLRKGRVYLDYLQNRRGQTMASPYSVRPKPGAPVSTPLEWDEVNGRLDPLKFHMKNILKRVEKKGDLWKPVLGKGVDLKAVLKKLARE
jgi:bifunctional non-homologous end joining protein LigD